MYLFSLSTVGAYTSTYAGQNADLHIVSHICGHDFQLSLSQFNDAVVQFREDLGEDLTWMNLTLKNAYLTSNFIPLLYQSR
jgi:hypothetical protein